MNRIPASFLLLFAPALAAFSQPPGQSLEAKVDAYIAPYVEAKDFSGAVLLAKGDRILLRKGYGLADQELGVANGPETKFQIASVTKTFTAAAVALLEKQGLLHLDDPLAKYIPDFPRGGEIRIAHLLAHSSGIPDVYSLPEYEEMKTRRVSAADLIALLKTKPLDFAPGTASSYSNSGYVLLAEIVEKVSGRSYQDFLRERIFAPLHLDHTGPWERQPIVPGRAAGYEPWLAPVGLIDPKTLDSYVGRYEVSPKMTLTVERRGGDLYLKGTGGFFLPLEPLSETRFFYRQLYVPLVFERGPDGKVSRLLWNGEYPCKKIG